MSSADAEKDIEAITAEENAQSVSAAERENAQPAAGKHAEHAKKDHAKARSRRWLRIALVVLGVIIVLCLVAASAVGVFLNSGKDELIADNNTSDVRKNMRHNGTNYVFNENVVTVALIGTDRGTGSSNEDGTGNADAIMMVAYDTETGKIKLINVPRNVVMTFHFEYDDGTPGESTNFISAAYAYGDDDSQGAELVCGALSDLFLGLPVENYVAITEYCIEPLTEAIGGVTLTAVGSVPYMGIQEGETYTLEGEKALRYIQYRDTTKMTSPLDRIERQKDFIRHFLPQTVAAVKKDPSVLGKLYDIITNPKYMSTNLNLNELAYLAATVMTNNVSDIEMLTLECDEEYKSQLLWYYPKEESLYDILLSTYYTPVDHF